MNPFTHYQLTETKDGLEVILYIDENLTEFSDELGTVPKKDAANLEQEAQSFVKRMFPSLKVKSVKIMSGAMLLTTLGFATLSTTETEAATTSPTESQAIYSYTVSAGDTLSQIAKRNGTTVQAIKQANNLSSNMLQIGQRLTIPSGIAANPYADVSAPAPTQTKYQVVSGDTLSQIAKQNGTTVNAIKQANNLSSDILQIGQELTIPSGNATNPYVGTSTPAQSQTHYTVVSGDTLSQIAKQNGTTVNAIKQANNLSSDILQIGQELTIPSGNAANPYVGTSTPAQSQASYTVVSGDTLSQIAKRNGTTVNAIIQANNLSSTVLQIGQTLTIPSGNATNPYTGQATQTPAPEPQAEQQTEVNQEEVEWLAKMIYSEGRGESFEGQVAIGAVIMNRVKSPLFPNNIKDVLFEKSYGYYQFTPAQTGSIHKANPNAQNMEAAKRAINGEDPTGGSLFFYNPDKASSPYLESRTVSRVIGNHTFLF